MSQTMVTRLVQLLGRLWRGATFWRLVKAYAVFGVSHMAFKILSLYLRNWNIIRKIKHLPGDEIDYTASDFIKNLHRLHDRRLEKCMEHKEAPLLRTSLPDIEVVCNTPDAVETMLKVSFGKVTKPSPEQDYGFKLLAEWLGDEGIFVMRHGDVIPSQTTAWHQQRKTASKIFTKSNFVKLMYDTLLEKSDRMIEALDLAADVNDPLDHLDRNAGAKPVNMQTLFFCFTFDSIQKILFNREVNTIGGQEDAYAQMFDQAHRELMLHLFASLPLVTATTYVLPFPFGSIQRSHMSLNPLLSFFRNYMEPHYQRFRKCVDSLHQTTRKLVQEARNIDPAKLEGRRDLLASFLKAKGGVSDKELQDVILNFILAGRDTTACTLTWMFYELSINPDVQTKAAEEAYRVLGKDGVPTLDDITQEKMPYLHGVMLETLRMHPPVPQDFKFTLEDVTFPDGTTIPAGVKLAFSPYVMGRHPDRYEDPDAFRPERWMDVADPTGSPNLKTMFEMPVFQAGPRYCLGMHLAKNEVKLLASRLLKRYTFQLEANEHPSNFNYSLMITMSLCNSRDQTSHDLWIVPRHRQWPAEAAAA